jgi:hypothetical protein
LVIYPVLGYLAVAASLAGLAAPTAVSSSTGAAVAGKALIGACLLAWAAGHLYDLKHPKLGHPPYDWRRLRPTPRPWTGSSTTLRAAPTRPHSPDGD